MNYFISLYPEDDGGYSAAVPGLPGCFSQGATREEALENTKEAITLYLDVAEEIASEGESEQVRVELKVA
jgi:predicted RNase H-like HicB family nuclease